jgi:hypothetical protein
MAPPTVHKEEWGAGQQGNSRPRAHFLSLLGRPATSKSAIVTHGHFGSTFQGSNLSHLCVTSSKPRHLFVHQLSQLQEGLMGTLVSEGRDESQGCLRVRLG